jgi:hypothetical protein
MTPDGTQLPATAVTRLTVPGTRNGSHLQDPRTKGKPSPIMSTFQGSTPPRTEGAVLCLLPLATAAALIYRHLSAGSIRAL